MCRGCDTRVSRMHMHVHIRVRVRKIAMFARASCELRDTRQQVVAARTMATEKEI